MSEVRVNSSFENGLFASAVKKDDGNFECIFIDSESSEAFKMILDVEKTCNEDGMENIRNWIYEAFYDEKESKNHDLKIEDGVLKWRHCPENSRSKIKIGDFPLKSVDYDVTASNFMALTVKETKEKAAQLKAVSDENSELKKKLKEYESKFDELVEAKGQLETKMYERFLPILHAKQEKLIELRSQLSKAEKIVEKDNEDEDSYGGETDVDEDQDESPPVKKSRSDESILDDSQNFLNV